LCEYCVGEGCICGREAEGKYSAPCGCETQGVVKCPNCGCEGQPWWSDIQLPESVTQLLWDLNGDAGFFPASKDKIVNSLSEEDRSWFSENLPSRTYQDTGDIAYALSEKAMPSIEWRQTTVDIIWKHPASTLFQGQHLIVSQDQDVVLVSRTGKACDEFAAGKYSISSSTCPQLLASSRKVLPGFQHAVLEGSPVFFLPAKEFEVSLSVMGQTKSLRRVMANGVARVRVSSPKRFVEQIGKKANYNSQGVLSALERYSADIAKKEMENHELDELSSSGASILGSVLGSGLRSLGLEPLNVNFSSVGEFGPGVFPRMPPQVRAGDPQSAEQMRQWAESMRATQMAKLQEIQQMQKQVMEQRQRAMQQAGVAPSATTNAAATAAQRVCGACNTPNPQTSKFCGNCGKPLVAPTKKNCPNCGQQSNPEIKFCGNCGTKL